MNSISQSQDHFSATGWSVVMQPAMTGDTDVGTVLAELGRRYCYPVYTYLRRCGHAPQNALETTCSFLLHLVEIVRQGPDLPAKSHFRSFLLNRLNAYLARDLDIDADAQAATYDLPPLADLEARFQHDKHGDDTPEQAYQRSFALEVIARAMARLHAEAAETGHLDMYAALERYMGSDPPSGRYEELATQLHMRPLALVVALKRLRQRFRELVGRELADTVASTRDLADEHRTLHSVLRKLS